MQPFRLELSQRFGDPISWFFSNSYMWVSLALFLALPIRKRDAEAECWSRTSRAMACLDRGGRGRRLPDVVDPEAIAVVERPRPDVSLKHP